MKRLRSENAPLDTADVQILVALAVDARTSVADLARMVGLSPPTVSERIRRLEDAGVIEGYTATISPKALGLPISAWLRVRPTPGQHNKVADILRGLPEIVSPATASPAKTVSWRARMCARSKTSSGSSTPSCRSP